MDNKKETICVVVVTYNRKQLLLECLESLLKQTYPLDAIYLIDNASSDGTRELLKEKGYIKKVLIADKEPVEAEHSIKMLSKGNESEDVKVHYVRMHGNTGGAGGFHEGVKSGYEAGYDWLWLMDDDVEPYEDSLEKLLYYKDISLCIHARKKNRDVGWMHWEGYLDVSTGMETYLNDISFEKGKKWTTVNIGCFEGMLINRIIVSKIGYPDKRFFIIGDDTVYGLMASMHTNVIYVSDAIFQKKLLKNNMKKILGRESNRLAPMSQYFYLRNFMLRAIYLKKYFPDNYNQRKVIFNFVSIYLRKMLGALIYDRTLMHFKYLTMGFVHGLARNFENSDKLLKINQH